MLLCWAAALLPPLLPMLLLLMLLLMLPDVAATSVCSKLCEAPSECTGIIRGKQMPTILTYQTKAALEAESLDTDRLLNNLNVGGWPMAGVIIKAHARDDRKFEWSRSSLR